MESKVVHLWSALGDEFGPGGEGILCNRHLCETNSIQLKNVTCVDCLKLMNPRDGYFGSSEHTKDYLDEITKGSKPVEGK